MKNKRLLDIFGEIDDRHIAEAAPVAKKSRNKPIWFRWGTIAACMVLVLSVCFGSFAVVAEAKEYKAAVQFFNDYGMSTEGLTRGEIKEVYHDITTKSFTYSKTAEVIRTVFLPIISVVTRLFKTIQHQRILKIFGIIKIIPVVLLVPHKQAYTINTIRNTKKMNLLA